MATLNSQGQVQYTAGEALPAFGSAAYNQAVSGVIPTTPALGTSIIDTNILTQPSNQLGIPPQPAPTPGITFVNGIPTPPVTNQPAQQPSINLGDNKTVFKRIQEAYAKLGNKGQVQQQLEQDNNIPVLNKQVTDLANDIMTKKAGFESEANRISGNAMTQEGLIGRTARLRREEAIELGGKSAALLALQGNLEAAKSEVDRTLKYEFEPIETEIAALKDFYQMNQNDLTESQKIKLQASINAQQAERDAYYSVKKAAMNTLLEKNPTLASKYAGAKSFTDMADINIDDFESATTISGQMEALTSTVDLINSIKDSRGLNSRVGPVGPARRLLAIPDAFGSGDAFAGSVHQLTSQQTLNALINLKQQGGTLGALSDGERRALEAAATKIGAWELKDKEGVPRGVWDISQKEFKKELDRLTSLTNLAIQRAGGQVGLSSDDYQQVQQLIQVPAGFNAANFF